MQSKKKSLQLLPQILQSLQEMLLEIWKSTVCFIKVKDSEYVVFIWLSLTLEGQYIMLYRVNYLKSIVTLSFSNYHTVSLQMI